MTTNAGRLTEPHSVWPEGPPCDEQCPGAWSQYHDGYAWGYEKAEAEVRARLAEEVGSIDVEALRGACRAWIGMTADEMADFLAREYDRIRQEGAKA